MNSAFAIAFLVVAAAVAGTTAQGSYKSILAEAQQWQQVNQHSCGLDTSSCGVAKMVDNFKTCNGFRIVNGCDVEKPLTVGWQAGILMGGGLCSGVLISNQVVLTAAHCFNRVANTNGIQVTLGSSNVQRGGQKYGASAFGTHPNYGVGSRVNSDVALIKLDRPVQLTGNDGIRAACLPVAGSTAPKAKYGLVSGFGTNNFQSQMGSGVMRYTLLQRMNDTSCQFYGSFDSAVSFCALGERDKEGSDTCQGDSGSSLLYKDNSGQWVSYGVVSYGASNCGEVPGVYADVAKLGINVPSRATSGQDKCRAQSDSKPLPPPLSGLPMPGADDNDMNNNNNNNHNNNNHNNINNHPNNNNNNGNSNSQVPKKPTYTGSSTSVAATVKQYGCRSNSECQSNICRPVALCSEKNDNFANLVNNLGSGHGGSGSSQSGSANMNGGSFQFTFTQQRLGGRADTGAVKAPRNFSTVQDILNTRPTLDSRQKVSGIRNNLATMFNQIRGEVGELFAMRKCRIHALCSAEKAQNHQQGVSPMAVAMFEQME